MRRSGPFSDLGTYFLSRPVVPTLIEFPSLREREDYSHRILQRIGVSVTGYSVLNIHRIGIETPVTYVFDELSDWERRPRCWPNWIATLDPGPDDAAPPSIDLPSRSSREVPAHLDVRLFGGLEAIHRGMQQLFGPRFGRLFRLTIRKRQSVPDPANFDNARYLVFECSGGYPIGIMAVYVRSPIAGLGEVEQSQLFMAVGFNFYGRRDWPRIGIVNRAWEAIHNRVTGNVLNEFKHDCESRCSR
jgi:hypothetical protein